jgi:hypothetical protein
MTYMTKLPTILLFASALSFGLASSAALADSANGNKTGFTTTTSQGGSGNTCTAGSPGCTTTTANGGGNNQTCTGPAGQCK